MEYDLPKLMTSKLISMTYQSYGVFEQLYASKIATVHSPV